MAVALTPDGLFFPDVTTLGTPRGKCGKKNCSGVVKLLGMPTAPAFGGSGAPAMLDAPPQAGALVPWQYNNMVAQVPMFGWVVMRLNPTQVSTAAVNLVSIDDEEVFSVDEITLHFDLYIRRMRLVRTLDRPLKLRLQSTSRDRMMFVTEGGPAVRAAFGLPLLTLGESIVEVTAEAHVDIVNVERTEQVLRWTVRTSVTDIEGKLAYFVHDPNTTNGWIPVGGVELVDGTARVEVDMTRYVALSGVPILFIEVVSLTDPRHLWKLVATEL
ncbi:MAG TPA: hypothetical protein VJ276_18910 [Thermoanaerobaculia bacterium]|nr:hypothetical protein [Thermoanaerobaculia bacterium]